MGRTVQESVRLVAREFFGRFPEEIRERLERVRLEVMERPTAELVDDGVEPGEGGAYIRRGEEAMPLGDGMTDEAPELTIYLFTANIRPLSREAIEAVLLHEVGHVCGMDEAEVAQALSQGEP